MTTSSPWSASAPPSLSDRPTTPIRAALTIARAAIQSVTTGGPFRTDELKDR
ncbi:hypothetical protein T261_8015 [Streptomyces lydicus]|nr:hypothetical protein T261_8015 [Streptomyces lydicus]